MRRPAISFLIILRGASVAAAAANGIITELRRATIGGIIAAMDDAEFKRKMQRALDAACSVAREDGCGFEETIERVARYLLNHPDPDVRALQRRTEDAAQRLRNHSRKDLH
jgi:hypothetical protein